MLAQLGWPDMRRRFFTLCPGRTASSASEVTRARLDFVKMGDLTFRAPDFEKYPSLTPWATPPVAVGGTMTGVFSAANEQAVAMFLDKKIGFFDIYKVIDLAMEAHKNELVLDPTLDDIVHFATCGRETSSTKSSNRANAPKLCRYRYVSFIPFSEIDVSFLRCPPMILTSSFLADAGSATLISK